MTQALSDDRGIKISGDLTLEQIGPLEAAVKTCLRQHPGTNLQADLSQITHLDTAGAVFLRRLPELAQQHGKELTATPLPAEFQSFYDFIPPPQSRQESRSRSGFLEQRFPLLLLTARLFQASKQPAAEQAEQQTGAE